MFSTDAKSVQSELPDSDVLSSAPLIFPIQSVTDAQKLISVAQALVTPHGKGIYASDEAPVIMDEILDSLLNENLGDGLNGLASTDLEKVCRRKRWRESAYNSLNQNYISGVILHSEDLLSLDVAQILLSKGIIPGVRANGELTPIPTSSEEFFVQGLDDLLPKLQAAYTCGARFSKWRVPIACSSSVQGLPTRLSLDIQADTLAHFAAISQKAGLVPIVEPDVEFSRDGDLERSMQVHEQVLTLTYERMRMHGVLLEGSLLKLSFPQPGIKNANRNTATAQEIARATATAISRAVPTAVAGVLFLSGGLDSETSTQYLASVNEISRSAPKGTPFARLPFLTFSFGRALQGSAMKCWIADDEQGTKASFEKWSRRCWLAVKGQE